MENNDSNKLQQTGGLKLMTVFILVLALHVIVIGGFTVYHLMSGGGTDTDLVSLNKVHKDITTTPEATQPVATTATTGTDAATTTPPPAAIAAVSTTPALAPTPAPAAASETSVANDTVAPPPGPAPELTPVPASAPAAIAAPAPTPLVANPGPLALAPSVPVANNPAIAALAPPPDASQTAPDATPAPSSLTPSGPLAGPVHMPPASIASSASHVEHAEHAEHVSGETYTVKITDSYKKIAKAHHVTVAELKAANHIHDNVLHTGQKLVIPAPKMEIVKSELKAGPSPLAAEPSTSVLSQAPAVRTAVLTSTTTTEVGVHEHTYTVVKGDTLTKIAHKFKVTTTALMAENNISDPARLAIGKKLRIPSRESRSATITSAPRPAPIAEPSEVKTETPTPMDTIRPTPPVEQMQDTPPAGDLATFQP